jgi:hypothetical protein
VISGVLKNDDAKAWRMEHEIGHRPIRAPPGGKSRFVQELSTLATSVGHKLAGFKGDRTAFQAAGKGR